MIQNVQFVRNNRIAKELILVDGLPRSGKSMLGPILSSFERVEIERMASNHECIPLFYSFNKIARDAAVALLRLEIDLMLYDSMISRNTNFRFRDRTGVFNNLFFLKHLKRLFLKDGGIVLERIKKERPIFQIQTHDMLQKIDLYFDAFGGGLRVIEMVRNPVDLIYSMNVRGMGTRVGNDPGAWQLAIKSKEGDVSYYASGWTDDFLKNSPINRLIKIVERLTKQMMKKYKSFSQGQKNQVLFIPFEGFAESPNKYLDLISRFINSKTKKKIKKTLKRQNVPRKIDIKEREKKLNLIKEKASEECRRILNNIIGEYENKYY